MGKKQLTKITAIILISVLIDIIFHIATSAFSTMPENPNYSSLAALLGVEITATLWALLAFSGAACVFYRVQANIPGTGLMKGLRYGTAISLLWLFAMLEGVPLLGTTAARFAFLAGLRFLSLCRSRFPAI